MSYFVCLGQTERYGNQAIPSSNGPVHIYKNFRFRDPLCPDTGRTDYIIPTIANVSEWILSVPTTHEADEIKDFTNARGLVWKFKSGDKPDDTQFTRHPHGYNIDSRPDRWQFGAQTKPKNNPPFSTNEGYIMSSTVAVQKQRGVIG